MAEMWHGIRVVELRECPPGTIYLHSGEATVHPAYWDTLTDWERHEQIDKLKRATAKITGLRTASE